MVRRGSPVRVRHWASATIRRMRRSVLPLALVAGGLIACGDTETRVEGRPQSRPTPAESPPGKLPPGRGYILARVRAPVLVHDRPNGRPFLRLRPKTPFDGPRTLGIVRVRDKRRWLAVHSPAIENDRIGWIQNDPRKL